MTVTKFSYRVAPFYMFGHNNECIGSFGWEIQGKVQQLMKNPKFDVEIPSLTQTFTPAFVELTVEAE